MPRDFQARLGTCHDAMKKKLLPNLISLTGRPTDVIAVKTTKNQEGDIISRIVEKAIVTSVIFPPLSDVPLRFLTKGDASSWRLTSLVNAFAEENEQNYTILASDQIDTDDLICRVFLAGSKPVVLVLEVKEPLGTFGDSDVLYIKYKCTLYTQELPQKLLNVIGDFATRRLRVKY